MSHRDHWACGYMGTGVHLNFIKHPFPLEQQSSTFWHQELISWKTIVPQAGVLEMVSDDSIALLLLYILFLLLLHLLHPRSSGIRFWRLGTPASDLLFVEFFLGVLSQ